jgi:acyl-[acyl-carrier-protein] desaturase
MLFYRNLLAAAFELAPDETMQAVYAAVSEFQMPGHTIENFGRKSAQIAMAGIYDLRIHHDEVVWPILRQLNIMNREDLTGEGNATRDKLAAFLSDLDRYATRFEERRDAIHTRKAARNS